MNAVHFVASNVLRDTLDREGLLSVNQALQLSSDEHQMLDIKQGIQSFQNEIILKHSGTQSHLAIQGAISKYYPSIQEQNLIEEQASALAKQLFSQDSPELKQQIASLCGMGFSAKEALFQSYYAQALAHEAARCFAKDPEDMNTIKILGESTLKLTKDAYINSISQFRSEIKEVLGDAYIEKVVKIVEILASVDHFTVCHKSALADAMCQSNEWTKEDLYRRRARPHSCH